MVPAAKATRAGAADEAVHARSACKRCGCCGTRLTSRKQQYRHAAQHGDFQTFARIFGKFQRRHNKAIRLRHKRTFAPFVFAARNHMQHLEHFRHMIRMYHTGADMFCRARNRGIGRIDVEFTRVRDFAAHIGALKKMDVVAMVDNARAIIKIDNG